jgi:hypothetical protein
MIANIDFIGMIAKGRLFNNILICGKMSHDKVKEIGTNKKYRERKE